ncbi:putative DsbA family dithiol-disulfide isomerase [Motilibacter peucedani]|uniref:Putative DsbA family dithiol-disulfide isomerase n=1 Tax=Motilibacter peucedani TaxID=598650 RepID=A0A420XLV8_9ACTN|nr:hypothetical protein [Motilibacter peucedani]RKS71389.1 putative DsbA family dithiol-disulfide isomerase [Motilibacter peucedani]
MSTPHPAPVAPGTVQVWSDLSCPYATEAVAALRETRAALGLELDVHLEHRAFPLETASPGHPETRVGLAAVRAASERYGLEAGEELDWALRQGVDATSREAVLEAAGAVPGVDADELAGLLERGAAAVDADWALVPELGIEGSPHVRLADGTSVFNPGAGGDPQVWDELLRRALDPGE